MTIQRWNSGATGRSQTTAFKGLVWTVSNAKATQGGDIGSQVTETLDRLDTALQEAGSDRRSLLSVQVLLSNIDDRTAFDALWCAWIGNEPQHWPQRAVYGAALAPGLLVEIMATAARALTQAPG